MNEAKVCCWSFVDSSLSCFCSQNGACMVSPLLHHPLNRPGSLQGQDQWMLWTPARTATARTVWSSTPKPIMGFTPRTAMGMGLSPTATPWPPWPWTSLIIRYADATVEILEAFEFKCDSQVTQEGAKRSLVLAPMCVSHCYLNWMQMKALAYWGSNMVWYRSLNRLSCLIRTIWQI